MGGIVLFFCALLVNGLSVRLYINAIIEYKLNKKALQNRKQNKSFYKWFSYSQYRDVVPPIMLFWYFAEIIFTFTVSAMSLAMYFFSVTRVILNTIFVVCLIIAITPRVFLSLFWGWYYGIPNKEQAAKLVDLSKKYSEKRKKHPLQKKK